MSCGKPIVTSNESYYNIFDDEMKSKCFFPFGDYEKLANKISYFLQNDENQLGNRLRDIVIKYHSLDNLSHGLVQVFEQSVRRKGNN